MELQEKLLDLEEKFWKGTHEFYESNLTSDALMVFAEPAGVMTRDSIVKSISDGARWSAIDFDEVSILELTGDSALLTYRARARRDGGQLYEARASSAYVDRDGWKLAFHQQTPLG